MNKISHEKGNIFSELLKLASDQYKDKAIR